MLHFKPIILCLYGIKTPHRPTMQPSSSVCLLDWFVSAGFPRVSGVPKNTAEEYTAIPDLPALRTSYPGAAVVEDGGEEEIRTL